MLVGEEDLYEAILQLRKKIEVPSCMKEVVLDEADVIGKLNKLVEKAFEDVCTPFTPVMPSQEEMKALILEVYYGEKQ